MAPADRGGGVRGQGNGRPTRSCCCRSIRSFRRPRRQSSLAAWEREARRQSLDAPTRSVRSYPEASGFIAALAASTRDALDAARADSAHPVRLLLSAHGLPEKIVKAGDPYPREVAATAAALLRALDRPGTDAPGIDAVVCYQSRVGPLAWIGPSVEEELRRAGRDRVGVIVVPVSFVSEHSETLVELDRDYRHLAERCGVPSYRRVPTVGTDPRFIAALADLVRGAAAQPRAVRATSGVSGFLVAAYPWLKALHIIAIIAWMAGLLYLPRLYVYHADVPPGSRRAAMLAIMERRLLRGIMLPAVVMTYAVRRSAAVGAGRRSTGARAGSGRSSRWCCC